MLFGMPDSFMRSKAKELFNKELPAFGEYSVSNVFFPPGSAANGKMEDCKAVLDRLVRENRHETLGWRPVPVDNSSLGKDPLDSEPITEQLFVQNTRNIPMKAFEQDLMRIRKMAEDEVAVSLGPESGFYINSMSSQHITYKGQLTPEQVSQYYSDLKDPGFSSHLAMVHSRFSTNTFPSWERAQPIRMMCHNGEINTLRGNKNWMHSRGGIPFTATTLVSCCR
jgi:glutamate synthase domain-containing protein 1